MWPTWQCERTTGVYEALPASRRRSSEERCEAVFAHEGEGFALHSLAQCSDHGCKWCGRWLEVGPDTWRWYCQCCHREYLDKLRDRREDVVQRLSRSSAVERRSGWNLIK